MASMSAHSVHKRHAHFKRIPRDDANEEAINQMLQIEAYELYKSMGWVFGQRLTDLLEEEVLEVREL